MPFYLLKNTVDSLRLLHKEQPDVVVCTGVLAMIPLHGSQALRQEADLHRVICQSDFGHTDGKTVISLCGSFYVQWTQMKEIYPDAICLGNLLG